jgi:hypothetical protein
VTPPTPERQPLDVAKYRRWLELGQARYTLTRTQLAGLLDAAEEREGLRRLLTSAQTLVSRGPQSRAWEPFFDVVAELSGAWEPPASVAAREAGEVRDGD